MVWNEGAKKKMIDTPHKVVYATMRQLLDYTEPTIPMKSGNLRRQTMTWGVMKDYKGYYVMSKTNYATHVYNLNSETTNWTTFGTNSEWFGKMWKEKKDLFIKTAIERYKLR